MGMCGLPDSQKSAFFVTWSEPVRTVMPSIDSLGMAAYSTRGKTNYLLRKQLEKIQA